MSSPRRVAAWRLNVIGSPLSVDPGPGTASSALEFGRHEQQRERLRAAFGAQDRLPRFGRRERRERLLEHVAGIGLCAHAARELIGDVEALRQAVEWARSRRRIRWERAAATAARPGGCAPASPGPWPAR